jgi:hypothetical protein
MLKLLPELSNKLCSTIRNDRLRYSMQMNNLIHIDLDILFGIIRSMHGKECAVLVNRSTITQMESCLSEVLGRPTIKSILMSSHFQEGIGRG